MSLSFEPINDESAPIAKIYGKDKKIVYLNDEGYNFNDSRKGVRDGIKKIVLYNDDSSIFPLIHENDDGQNDRIFICGKSGCGKTYNFIRPYIIDFYKKFKSNIWFFSSKPQDDAVDDLPIKRVEIDDKFVENPPDVREFANQNKHPNLVVFDDVQDYKKKTYNKAVQQLRDEILRNGRSMAIYIIYVWHKPADHKNTEQQIFESTATVIFPKTSGHDDYDYLMKRYLGLSNAEQKNLLKKAKSKYVYVTKKSPAVAISDKYILLLK